MKKIYKKIALAGLVSTQIALAGCATHAANGTTTGNAYNSNSARISELDAREKALNEREAALNSASGGYNVANDGDLLPPNAQPGECYARIWVDAEYETITEQVLDRPEAKEISVIPAQYETVSETVMVSAASSRLETIPAVYGTESETIKVAEATRTWRTDLGKNSAPASDALLATAVAHGINLESASPGMCFHEHYLPETYKTVTEQVVTKGASEEVTVIPAQYEMVEETILVKEASTRLVEVPAEYETVSEQVIDKPAHTIWKKGTGPIQRIDESTGEIMCLVEVPATYKTVTRTQLKSPARTEVIEIPAEYKTVAVRKLVSAASEQRTPIPAVYGEVQRSVVDTEGQFVWHEIHNDDHPASTRTGNKICLTETEAKYKTVERTVVTTPAQTRSIEIPAEYKTVDVTKLVSEAREEVTVIPAEYKTVSKQRLLKDGYMAWRSILCETNMTVKRISDIQRALSKAGYDVKSFDGVIGAETINAVNAFQRDNNLPVDKYLNIETVKALGVSVQ